MNRPCSGAVASMPKRRRGSADRVRARGLRDLGFEPADAGAQVAQAALQLFVREPDRLTPAQGGELVAQGSELGFLADAARPRPHELGFEPLGARAAFVAPLRAAL